ncbi:alpha/beta fold hydrolase [Enterovirga rhinocerotis]|uniref:Pimeloyl-ACP methyl ester carboxylesterase n=1 Tax=Enterovirga rhinocerotis TaxID=1339210 RepID=A0A4R7BWA7_9HYPH|nr:alpha/beta hydrolase [Enterovirga rhinocerotis]TDR89851.1 pimeloyl-ACP methyl ester carboxylesterase [Enterovirga rhinocerotis]
MSAAVFEPVVGRYLRLDLLGKPHRLYVEEAGQGIPLLCLHTAGSDSRQYRAVLNDPAILKDFRVIAFDLPWHGKSSPPSGWHEIEEYRLTSRDYADIVVGVADALGLDQPVAMGCSIGGRIVLHLALEHPDRFGAVIGLQSGGHVAPYYDMQWLHRPDVHGEVSAAVVSGLIGPNASDADRWETLWHYMQGGPGIFKGDLYFYKVDGDIRGRLREIDTQRCPVHLLTGEYDYSCTPEDTLAAAASIPGANAVIMPGIGHFPMSEDPEGFLTHLRPVLERIRAERRR